MSLITTHTLRADCLPETEGLDAQLCSFWELESLGVQGPDKSVYEDFSNMVSMKLHSHGRIQNSCFLTTTSSVLKCLQGLLRRLRQDENVVHEYGSIIQNQVQ